jgi:hypothetical protein
MRVRDLLHHLKDADPDAVVLYIAAYADASDAEAIVQVTVLTETWTCERHRSTDGRVSDIYHPVAGGLSLGWDPKTDQQSLEPVVILSSVQRARYD